MIDLDDLEQLRLYDTQGQQVAAAGWRERMAEAGIPESAVDAAWLDSLLSQMPRAHNPAKQLALRLYERTPLFWAASHLASLPPLWQQQVMHAAEAAALSATLEQMARDWSMVRLPRFWPNALVGVWISDGGEDPAEQQLAVNLQTLLQKRRYQVIRVAVPRGATPAATTWHGHELGSWVALYLAALYGVDPAERVPWQYLGLT
jgi:hypothetical protein